MNKVHFVLDEAASLGRMDALDDAVDKYRGYGVRLQFYFQSVSQLRKCFPDGQDQTLLSNVSQVFSWDQRPAECGLREQPAWRRNHRGPQRRDEHRNLAARLQYQGDGSYQLLVERERQLGAARSEITQARRNPGVTGSERHHVHTRSAAHLDDAHPLL
jgi:hypothetical protein